MPALPSSQWKVALVGASTLLGKEVKSVLGLGGLPLRRLELIDSEQAAGQLTEFEGDPAFLRPISAELFEGMDLAIFASNPSLTDVCNAEILLHTESRSFSTFLYQLPVQKLV